MKCRHCHAALGTAFADLGSAPPSNAFLSEADLHRAEVWYPLRVLVCAECRLVQSEDYAGADEIFSDSYVYFSSSSRSRLEFSERYVVEMIERFGLGGDSLVVELAANDGYLLQYVKARNIPCIGIEPTASTARAARERGIDIVQEFFGVRLAREMASRGQRASLMPANNVLAHVPDINDFVAGTTILLRDDGVATFEFPYLLALVENSQFDTIYHEHYSYLSFTTVHRIMASNGLAVFDVQDLSTHGGSLRVFAQRTDGPHRRAAAVEEFLQREKLAGVDTDAFYAGFQRRIDRIKNDFLGFLLEAKRSGKRVAAYGAAAKGNTLINYAGVRQDLLPYVVDKSPPKQGMFLPGSRIPVVSDEHLRRDRPDLIVVLAWNLWDEVLEDLRYARQWGARFVRVVPELIMG